MTSLRNFLNLLSNSNDPRGVIGLATKMKEEGNILFKEECFEDALEKYGYAGLILGCYEFGEVDRPDFFELATCVLLSSAACFSKKREFEQVGIICTLMLDFNPNHVKALFRRATPAVEMGKNVYAYYDLVVAREVDPSNKEVKQKLQQVTDSLHDKAKRKSLPAGPGIGLATERKKAQKKPATGATANEEGHVLRDGVKNSVGSEKSTDLKENNEKEIKKDEMMVDCGKEANAEG